MFLRFPALAGCLFLAINPVAVTLAAENVPPQTAPSPGAIDILKKLDEGFTAVFQAVAPSVVVIQVEKKSAPQGMPGLDGFDLFLRRQQDSEPNAFDVPRGTDVSEGSGFILREDGYILTNNHVVENARAITVRLKDGREFPAKLVGADDKTDIAVVKVEAAGLPAARLGDSSAIRVGQLVFSIGIPYNLAFSFSGGWVSAIGRDNLLKNTDPRVMYEDYIQTDAFINPGNSGGPLLDIEGRVIGMNSFINGIGRGLSFAIPSNMLADVSQELIEKGRVTRPWLGIRMLSDGEALEGNVFQNGSRGVVVQTIYPDTPAYESDLRPLDVITAVDGRPVESTSDMQKAVLNKKVGETLELTVTRSGKPKQITIRTAELPDDPSSIAGEATPEPTPKTHELFGLQLQDVTADLQEQLGLRADTGALVSSITPQSVAALADVQRGDVITEINSNAVRDATQALQMLKDGDAENGILLFLDRKGQKTYAVLKSSG